MRHRRTAPVARALALAVVAVAAVMALSGCTDSGSSDSSSTTVAVPTLSAAVFDDWFGLAAEVALPCQVAVTATNAALDAVASAGTPTEYSVEVMLAAGQAIESCPVVADDEAQRTTLDGLRATFPSATDLMVEWMDASVAAANGALIVAAENYDARELVGAAYEAQHRADDLALRLGEVVTEAANRAGVTLRDPVALPLWDPPDH